MYKTYLIKVHLIIVGSIYFRKKLKKGSFISIPLNIGNELFFYPTYYSSTKNILHVNLQKYMDMYNWYTETR